MINDLYNQVKNSPAYKNKLVGSNYLLVEYKCPIDTLKFQLMSELHFFMYVFTGRKDWTAAGKTYKVNEGDALFVRKGAYTTRQYFDVDYCVLLLFINDDFIRNFILENDPISVPEGPKVIDDQVFQLDVDESLRSLFYSMLNYLKMSPEIPRNLVELKFQELLFNVVLNPKNKKLTQFFTSLNQTGKTNLDYVMMKNFQHDLELEEFARLYGKSLSAFKRDFKNHFHQTPGQWLKDKRLEYARGLLLHSDLDVKEVCYESGFRNPSHFNKAFKDKYRLPPNQLRMQVRNA